MSIFERLDDIVRFFVRDCAVDVAENTSISTQILTLQYGNDADMCELMLDAFSASMRQDSTIGINLAISQEITKCPQKLGICYSILEVVSQLSNSSTQNAIASLLIPPPRPYGFNINYASCDIGAIVAYIKAAINGAGVVPFDCGTHSDCSNAVSAVQVIQLCSQDLIDGSIRGASALSTLYLPIQLLALKSAVRAVVEADIVTAINDAVAQEKIFCPSSTVRHPGIDCCKVWNILTLLTGVLISKIAKAMKSEISGLNLDGVKELIDLAAPIKTFMTTISDFPTRTTAQATDSCVAPNSTELPDVNSLYICGTPGINFDRRFTINGTNYIMGGSSWDFISGLTQAYGEGAGPALKLYQWIKFKGASENTPCETQSNCSASEVCGTLFVPGVEYPNSIVVGACGPRLGWWSPNILCTTAASSDAFTNQNPKIDCASYGKDNGQTTPWYSCASPIGSCYSANAQSNCCGCLDWWADSCNVQSSNTNVLCGLPVTSGTEPCVNYNPPWAVAILPSLIWRKLACPTCYAYQYDDHSSTFTCPSSDINNVRAYHLVACPENGGYTLSNITSDYSNVRIVRVLNNCKQPIWPAMSAATSNRDDGVVECTANRLCPEGSSCIFVRTDYYQCYWHLYDPTDNSGGYQLNIGESLEFRMPIPKSLSISSTNRTSYPHPSSIETQFLLSSTITWSGAFAMRMGCSSISSICDISDCRSVPTTTFRCDNERGISNPATLAEITFQGGVDSDFYDVGIIDAPTIGLAWVPSNAIPGEIYAPPPQTP